MTLSAKLCNKDDKFEKLTIIPDFQIFSEKITFEKIFVGLYYLSGKIFVTEAKISHSPQKL